MDMYTGIEVFEVNKEIIEKTNKEKEINFWDENKKLYQNQYLVIKDVEKKAKTILGVYKKDKVCLLSEGLKACQIIPKNKEQCFALNALLDDNIGVVILTGRAGSGKTILSLAAAMQKFEEGKYRKIILSRPFSQVGKYDLGALPGTTNDKMYPYLLGYSCNLDLLIGEHKNNLEIFSQQYRAEFIPIQLMRGASFHKSFIIVDECQVLNEHEFLTIGSRVVDGSKIVIMGDLRQRDEKIPIEKTGIYNFVNSELAKNSDFVATIDLKKSERGKISSLFADIFEK